MKPITDPKELAVKAAAEFKDCYGDELLSVIVYGSAAGGDFNPKSSDINLLIVLKDANIETMAKSSEIQKRWMKRRFSRPLFMDKAYIDGSLDSFPIEFLNMKGCYQVVSGEDVLGELEIRTEDLRLQAERELKGKRLHLMQEWLQVKDTPRMVKELLAVSMRDFAATFRALLHLKGEEIPKNRMDLFAAVGQAYGLENRPFARTLEAFQSGNKNEMIAIFPDYAGAIRRLSEIIDQGN